MKPHRRKTTIRELPEAECIHVPDAASKLHDIRLGDVVRYEKKPRLGSPFYRLYIEGLPGWQTCTVETFRDCFQTKP